MTGERPQTSHDFAPSDRPSLGRMKMLGTALLCALALQPPSATFADGGQTFVVRVVGGTVTRLPGKVVVTVRLAGVTGGKIGSGDVVTGNVLAWHPTPCWDRDMICIDVEDEQTRSFVGLSTTRGRFIAQAGPFSYWANLLPPSQPVCSTVGLRVTARWRGLVAHAAGSIGGCV